MATGINNAISVVRPGVAINTGAASVNSPIPTAANGLVPYYIRVVATAAAYVRVGNGAQVAAVGDLMIQPDAPTIICCGPNINNIAAIQVAAPGVVQVSPLENQ